MIRLCLRAMIRAEIPLSAARVARVMLWPQMVTLVPGPAECGANPVISRVTEVVIRPIESAVELAHHIAPSLPRAIPADPPRGCALLCV
jgi:hypothetical protein